ncbi:MAG: UDP-N-acetylmuramoyl-L-alanine--D-glutamate ligase [Endomicrobium sp.]|jgi:UDP-N-acetylmuramoylalanine--D-glutamate ligase|nr:UDP-N-acetylmuramoyl-L-alanine--D-glutamate ligase [Endomicrobium sp.]
MNKSIGVLGLGKSGVAVANLAAELGYNVFASDSKNKSIEILNKKVITEFGEHSGKILNSDVIIKSPGICLDIPILKKARKLEIPVISEISFSLKKLKYKKIIAITGTNGKTTTADLTSKIVKLFYKNSIISGNIGYPLADEVLKTTKDTIIILELSSYQLEDTPDFRANISVLLNITPDHLEHHKTMKAYIKAKKNIFMNQNNEDFTIVNYDDEICRIIFKKAKTSKVVFFSRTVAFKNGVFYDNGDIVIATRNKHIVIQPKINIVGVHNMENILAAVAASYVAGVDPNTIEEVISKYQGMEHRIEFVRTLSGVNYYNDSKSTNVDSTKVALKSFEKNILIIMGGRDKGFSYTPLAKLVTQKVKSIFLIGEASDKIKRDLKGVTVFVDAKDIGNAVNQIFRVVVPGDTVLLSPACASFDQFKDFEERGKFFKQIVYNL